MPTKDNLEAIIDLTNQKNQDSLLKCFVKLAKELTPIKDISIFEIREGGNEGCPANCDVNKLIVIDPLDYSKTQTRLIELEGFSRCIRTGEKVRLENSADCCRFIIPIFRLTRITHILFLKSENNYPTDDFLLQYLVPIFSNQLFLISSTEHDALTGLLNRKAFNSMLSRILITQSIIDRRRTDREHYTHLAIMDLDHFKDVNDSYGHLIGDEVLLHFSAILKNTFRYDDLLFRYGGEEFVVILKNLNSDNALTILQRFRRDIERHHFPLIGKVTTSIGFVNLIQGEAPFMALDKADKALYYAKKNGRNQAFSYERLISEHKLKQINYEGAAIDLY